MAVVGIYKKLLDIQSELKAPKGQYNSFGKYKYRSCEDILEAVKPICKKFDTALIMSDEIQNVGDRYYVEATTTLIDITDGSSLFNKASAREEETKKGMDASQITGTASSYARKYALNGLFCIDDTKDADTDEFKKQTEDDKVISENLLKGINEAIKQRNISSEEVSTILNKYGYTKTSEIKMSNYMNIINEFRKIKGD